jgi:predicted aldo/keto reductase-like oxidoreductase
MIILGDKKSPKCGEQEAEMKQEQERGQPGECSSAHPPAKLGRRNFIRTCLSATAAFGALSVKRLFPAVGGRHSVSQYDPKGLPTRILGKTGVAVPRIGIGCGSRFCSVQDPEKSLEILTSALDHGFYYWDTANNYITGKVISEERLGLVLKDRRSEVFLASKVEERTYDGAMRQLEESLRRLQTDHLDIYQIHQVESLEDVDRIGSRDGVLKALHKLKDEKVTRFIGYSGHLSAEAMTAMVNRYDFDTMLIALNHYEEVKGDMEKRAIPAAAAKNMGVMVIKVIRPRETVPGIVPEELIRYALTLEHVDAAVIGTDSLEVVRKNAELLKNFQTMSPDELRGMKARLAPFRSGRHLPWMHPDYTDGMPV